MYGYKPTVTVQLYTVGTVYCTNECAYSTPYTGVSLVLYLHCPHNGQSLSVPRTNEYSTYCTTYNSALAKVAIKATMADNDGAGNWCLIDSDPRVFTELIKGFGVSGVQVEELWSLEKAEFQKLNPIHGLVFLFKWRPGEETVGSLVQDSRRIYFAKQVQQNKSTSC